MATAPSLPIKWSPSNPKHTMSSLTKQVATQQASNQPSWGLTCLWGRKHCGWVRVGWLGTQPTSGWHVGHMCVHTSMADGRVYGYIRNKHTHDTQEVALWLLDWMATPPVLVLTHPYTHQHTTTGVFTPLGRGEVCGGASPHAYIARRHVVVVVFTTGSELCTQAASTHGKIIRGCSLGVIQTLTQLLHMDTTLCQQPHHTLYHTLCQPHAMCTGHHPTCLLTLLDCDYDEHTIW